MAYDRPKMYCDYMYIDILAYPANMAQCSELAQYPNDSARHNNVLFTCCMRYFYCLVLKGQPKDGVFRLLSYYLHHQKIDNLSCATYPMFEAFLNV